LTQNGLKLIFYPGGLGFDPKRPETHFLPWSIWFDPVDLVLIENDGFDLKRPENSCFTLVDMV
jgi:hypothetical protein